MLTGKQKAQLLVSLLKDKSQKVLNKLSPESATFLTSSIEDTPETNPELIDEIVKNYRYLLGPVTA